MKKTIFFLFILLFNANIYSYEPTHPYYCFEDYINQIENLINNNFEVSGNTLPYIIMEYSGDDLNKLDINNENIKNLYLIENQKIQKLSKNKNQNYRIIKKLLDIKGDYFHIRVVYFKICENNIYVTLDDYRNLVRYQIKMNLKKNNNKTQISDIPEMFDNFDYFKQGLTVYNKWYE